MLPKSALVAFAIFAATATSYGQDAGGAYVYWNPAFPTPAYDAYEWTITVVQLPNAQSYYYWALQNGFVGGDTFSGGASCPEGPCSNGFYMGLQPYGTPVAPCPGGASGCKIALFSFFGNGASSTSPNCASGADGGPGESCRIIYDWHVGRPYKFVATLTANAGGLETWTATVTDTTTGVQTAIASWSIPTSNGLLGTSGVSFTEYFAAYTGGCRAEPYAEVIWNVPIGYNNGQAYPNTVGSTAPTTLCPGNSAFAISPSSVTVQTGGSWPLISSVQDAESSRASVVPGEWVAIYGNYLSNSTRSWNAGDFTNGNRLPTSLDGVSVQFGGIPAAVCFVSPTQIDVQAPAGLSGTVPVTVTVNSAQSASFMTAVMQIAPSLFFYTNAGGSIFYAAAQHAGGSLIGDPLETPNATPASAGETIVLYVNGLEASASGTIISTVVPDNNPVTVTIGGLNSRVIFEGLVEAGLFQVNVVVPTGIETANIPVFSDLSLSNDGAGYCISGPATANCGPMTYRWIASPFTPGADFALTQIDLALGWSSGTNGAVIDLVNGQGGVPGTSVLQSWMVTQLPPSGPTALITLTPDSVLTLNGGTEYWLVVQGSAANTLEFWSGNTAGLTGSLLSLNQGASWNNGVLNRSAFDVLGTPTSGIVPVPVVVTVGSVSSQANIILPVRGN